MILVTGATGYTGRFLVRRLVEQGLGCRCLVRPSSNRSELDELGVEVCCGDLEAPEQLHSAFRGVSQVLHLAHIRFAAALGAALPPSVQRVVLVSSMWRFSKVACPEVEQVVEAEERVVRTSMPYTIVRPTMIYGPGDDRNIAILAQYLRRRRWIPMVGDGEQLQQPVYVEDVVDGILAAARCPEALGRAYGLAGLQALTYNQLVDLVGEYVECKPIKIHLPLPLVLAGVWAVERLGLRGPVGRAQLLRQQEDKSCSIDAARNAFGFAPLSFRAGLERIYRQGGAAQ